MAVHGQVWDEKADDGTGSNQVNSLLKSLETESSGTLPMIRPGDASVAAPFTSRCNINTPYRILHPPPHPLLYLQLHPHILSRRELKLSLALNKIMH